MSVSVVIPCYDEWPERVSATVAAALRSGADDVVMIDDGSHFVPEPGPSVRCYRQEHLGIAAALNHGFRRALHDYVIICAVGDLLVPGVIAAHGRGSVASFGDWTSPEGVKHIVHRDWWKRMWTDNQFSIGGAMVHRLAWEEVEGFDESLQYAVDWNFVLRIEYAFGWTYCGRIVMVGAEYPDGHSDRAEGHSQRQRWQRKCQDSAMVARYARKHELEAKGRRLRMAA